MTSTAMHNADIAAAFEEMADLLSIQGENPFRIRAYRRAAQIIRGMPRELADMHGVEEFDALPGIGEDLASKIAELLRSGRSSALERLRRAVPAGVRELLGLPGLGPARVRALFNGLGVRGIDDLKRAITSGRIAELRGFGPGLQSRFGAALRDRPALTDRRLPYSEATSSAEPLQAYLRGLPGVIRVEVAGSYRRGRDTVGDLDVLTSGGGGAAMIAALKRYPAMRELTAAGATKAAGVLKNGLRVDFRMVPAQSFGAALHYFTGSRAHSIRMRRRAQAMNLKLNEYGLYRGRLRIAGATEEDLFDRLGLPWIPPELREDRGEIEAAERRELPRLIGRDDLRGDLHAHTDASDGGDSLRKMAAAARARGLGYLAITDHSKYLGIVHGQNAARLARQIDAIDTLNATLDDFVVLKGAEVDVLEDGRLALPDAILRRLDLVVIAIHSQFHLSQAKQTARLLRALDRPCVSVLAHPFGRLLERRPPYAIDFERVLDAARARPCYLEMNGQPSRLDLDDLHAKAARDRGVLLSIASDAHDAEQLRYVENGVRQARRGWVTRKDVLNTREIAALRVLLRRTMH